MKENYHLKMKEILKNLEGVPTLLLHTCCAPCSTTAIQRLSNSFFVTVFYYNPNIFPKEEYLHRKEEQIRFLKEYPSKYPIAFLDCDYDPNSFFDIAKGHEDDVEGGTRCHLCYRLRMEKTAQVAKEHHFDYFATSLTVSPYKNSEVINQIGSELEEKYSIFYLYSDLKKEDGYKESIAASKRYQLYRQDYCGCVYSKKARDLVKKEVSSK